MKPLAAITSILVAGAVAGPVFAETMFDGMKVPVPTPRPSVTFEVAQAPKENTTDLVVQSPASELKPDMMTTGAIEPGVSGVDDYKAVDVTKINVMRVDEISDDKMRDQYRQTDNGNSTEVQKLQADIRTNADLVAALQAHQVDVKNIISAQLNGDNTVTFIVR